jgi:hypothetical protein
MLILWLYSIGWAATAISFLFQWHVAVPMYAKVAVVVVLVLGTPSLSDLFQSYSSYSERWKQENARSPR